MVPLFFPFSYANTLPPKKLPNRKIRIFPCFPFLKNKRHIIRLPWLLKQSNTLIQLDKLQIGCHEKIIKVRFENLKLKCECGGSMEKIKTEWKGILVRGWKCKKCKEEVLNPMDAQKALEIEKARKEHKLRVKLRRVGKSDVITVPVIIKEVENLRTGQELEWSIEGKKLVLNM